MDCSYEWIAFVSYKGECSYEWIAVVSYEDRLRVLHCMKKFVHMWIVSYEDFVHTMETLFGLNLKIVWKAISWNLKSVK